MSKVNPFLSSIVADPWDADVTDVPCIHAAAFDVCREALADVCRTGSTRSVLVHGEPGSGKTHLLSRLRRHLTRDQNASAEGNSNAAERPPHPPAVFSALRLRSGSRMICRHVRRALVRDLLRPVDGGLSQLEWLLIYRAAKHVNHPQRAHAWWRRLRLRDRTTPAEEEAEELFRRLDSEFQLGRNLASVLVYLALGRHPREVRDWLVEGRLPDDAMRQLQLIPLADEVDAEEEALDVIFALSRLAGPEMPLLIGFDQVEALQTHSRDLEGPFAFGRMVSALHDRTRYTLLITGVQSTFLEMLDASIRAADMDRLREATAVLEPLDESQARLLVAERLRSTEWLRDSLAGRSDACWPVGSDRIEQYVQSSPTGARTPRRLIAFCRDRFHEWQHGSAEPSVPAERFLEQQFDRQFADALRTWRPSQSDETLIHGLPLALEFLGPEFLGLENVEFGVPGRAVGGTSSSGSPWTAAELPKEVPAAVPETELTEAELADIDLVWSHRGGRTLVSVCNGSGNGLTGRLKRLRGLVQRRTAAGLVVLRDARIPWPPMARKAREHLDALGQSGAHVVRPTAEAMAALEALRSLLSDAKAGDLAQQGQTLSARTVQQWLADNLPAALKELLHEVAPDGPPSAADPMYDEVLALLQQRHVVRVADLAEQLDREVEQVVRCLERHREQFCTLSGPPAVIFERIAAD